MSNITRRTFLKRTVVSSISGGVALSGASRWAQAGSGKISQVGTLIDLTKCDGCKDQEIPACVNVCREKNKNRFPKPVSNINNYWPQKKYEDWSEKRDLVNRLTPYNWTFVQKVEVEHQGKPYELYIQRRCMHCDNPPCVNLCPFNAQEKKPEGPVLIDPNICFGGAKCRDVCPWAVPQRQAGVGLYLKVAPKYVGGGVMYKCDLCYDLLQEGKEPGCIAACPQRALVIGEKETIRQLARARAEEISGFIYGEKENGGTSTYYVSPVPFGKIHQSLREKETGPGMPVGVGNFLDTANGMAYGFLVAPIAGAFAAGWSVVKTMKGEN